jgi:hypothetical protein
MPKSNDRVNPWVPSRVPKSGLEVQFEQDSEDQTWGYRLTDPASGHVVHSRYGYGNASGVSQAVNSWIRDRYKPDRKQGGPPALVMGPGTSALQRQLVARADDNEGQAIRLREQADRLETEAKKLRAAADVLGEDYG